MKILLLTSLYPVPGFSTNTTPVVHFFAREWVKMGIEVKVIHNENKYLLPLYFIPRSLKNWAESKFGVRIPNLSQRLSWDYELDGVKIHRIPFLKAIPFGTVSDKMITKHCKKIVDTCRNENFIPDYIIGHWEYPQIPIIVKLKNEFKFSLTTIVFHSISYINKFNNVKNLIKEFDYVGFRSKGIKEEFENLMGNNKNSFLCYSGIPDKYVKSTYKPKEFNFKLLKFSYVGLLIQRKYPEVILRALLKSNIKNNFNLNIVGEGSIKKLIESDIKAYNVNQLVSLQERLTRDQVIELMSESDFFIMISKDEAFGLVYLEAMLTGCIVIAAKNEGMDGIIVNGINGFLINAGDQEELILLLNDIYSMELSDLKKISNNAIQTVHELTDSKVAKNYLLNLNIIN